MQDEALLFHRGFNVVETKEEQADEIMQLLFH